MLPGFKTPWPGNSTYFSQIIRVFLLFLFLTLQSNLLSVSGRAVFTGSNAGSTQPSAVDVHADYLANPQMEISVNGNAITNSNSRYLIKSSSSVIEGPKQLLASDTNNEEQDYSSSGFQLSFHHLRVPQAKETPLRAYSLFESKLNTPFNTNQDHDWSLVQSPSGARDHVPPYSEDIIPSYDVDYEKDEFSNPTGGQEESFYMMDQPSSGHAKSSMQPPIQKFYSQNSLKSSFNKSPFNSKTHTHNNGIVQPPPKTFSELFEVDVNGNPKIDSSEDSSQFPAMVMPRNNMLLRNIVNHHVTHSTGKDQDEPSYYYRLMFSVFDLNGKFF